MWWWQDEDELCRDCCLRKIDCEFVMQQISTREEPQTQRTGGAVRYHQTPLRHGRLQQIFHDQNSSSHFQQSKLPRSVPACQPRFHRSEVQDPRKDLWSRKIIITMHANRVSKLRKGSAIKFCTHRISKIVSSLNCWPAALSINPAAGPTSNVAAWQIINNNMLIYKSWAKPLDKAGDEAGWRAR